MVVIPKITSNLAIVLIEKRKSKTKEKPIGSALLNWSNLTPWHAIEQTVAIGKIMNVDLLLNYGPMQVMSSTPETTKLPEVRLSFERVHFWPGEVVRGVLTLNVTQPRLIHGLQLAFDGVNYVDWYDEVMDMPMRGMDVYFSKKEMLLGQLPPPSKLLKRMASKNGEHLIFCDEHFHDIGLPAGRQGDVNLTEGLHHFPFAFSLPMGIPHSMSHLDGCVGVFYFVTARIFECHGKKVTLCREEIQIAPPRVSITYDPSVSHTQTESKIISKHGALCDNFSQSLPDKPELDDLHCSFSDTSSIWSRSNSSFDHHLFMEDSHLKSISFSDDVDLDGADSHWLSRKSTELWAIKAFQTGQSEDKSAPISARSAQSTDYQEATSQHSDGSSNAFNLVWADDRLVDDEEDGILGPKSHDSDSSDSSMVGTEIRKWRSNSRPAPVAVNAILPPLAAIGKALVFQVTIENRSNKPINSLRASLRSRLTLSGYPSGRPYKRLREHEAPRGTIVKAIFNAKNKKGFPIQPGMSWRGDMTLVVPPNLYPSLQVRHLNLSYEIKLQARSSSKLILGSFTWKQPIQVVQSHADKEVQLIEPPTQVTGDPCQLILGKATKELHKNLVPIPVLADGTLPITGFSLPKSTFK